LCGLPTNEQLINICIEDMSLSHASNELKYTGRIFIYLHYLHYFLISTINLQIICIQHLFSKNLFFSLSYSITVATFWYFIFA